MPNRGRGYVSLVERGIIRMPPDVPAAGSMSAAPTSPPAPDPPQPPASSLRRLAEGRHVWVRTEDGGQVAGLLTQWRLESVDQPADDRSAGGRAGERPPARQVWVGLVVYVTDVEGQPRMIQAWEPADRLRPARPVEPTRPVSE